MNHLIIHQIICIPVIFDNFVFFLFTKRYKLRFTPKDEIINILEMVKTVFYKRTINGLKSTIIIIVVLQINANSRL